MNGELDHYTHLYGKYLAYRWGNRNFLQVCRTKLVSHDIEIVNAETWALYFKGRFQGLTVMIKASTHNTADCRVLKNMKTNKALVAEYISAEPVEATEEVQLDNPTEVDPSLILMNTEEENTFTQPLFTHNCQIKNSLAAIVHYE